MAHDSNRALVTIELASVSSWSLFGSLVFGFNDTSVQPLDLFLKIVKSFCSIKTVLFFVALNDTYHSSKIKKFGAFSSQRKLCSRLVFHVLATVRK